MSAVLAPAAAQQRTPLRRLVHNLLMVLLATVGLGIGLTTWERWLNQRAVADLEHWLLNYGEPPTRLTVVRDKYERAVLDSIRLHPRRPRIVAVHTLGSSVRATVCVGDEKAYDMELDVRPNGARLVDLDRGDRKLCQVPASRP